MTTSGGSVWDRGPGGDDDERTDGTAPDEPTFAAQASDETPAEDGESDVGPPDETVDSGTVWSRGPTIEATIEATAASESSPRSVPAPVLPPPRPAATSHRTRPQVRRPVALLVGAAVVVALGVLAWMLGIVGGDDAVPAVAGESSVVLMPPVSLPSSTTDAAPTTTLPPTTTLAATTSTSTSTTSTTTSTTSTTTSTTSTTTSTTSTTTSTSTTSTSTTTVPEVVAAGGPVVAIVGHVGPCKFGNDCLIADFALQHFETPQDEFVCEFGNGSRYTFRFDGVGADGACATSAADGTITIEVGGVRSETVTR